MSKWQQRWGGAYTFLSCSYWGPEYFHTIKKVLGKPLTPTVFIHKKGSVSFHIPKEALDNIGHYFVNAVKQEPSLVNKYLDRIQDNAKILYKLMDKYHGKILTPKQYEEYITYYNRHLPLQVFMKKTLEYLPPDMLEKLSPKFKEARFYAEPVYSRTEKFFRALAASIGRKENIDPQLPTCLTRLELENYLENGMLPQIDILKERFNSSVLHSEEGNLEILTGNNAAKLENTIFEVNASDQVSGKSAHPGKVKGKVKIMLDPYGKDDFQKGDILVTGMTNPDFLPIMEKASAVITDAGGLLCHAAIVAREMNLPTVIGTENATKILKDGDLVEVDAEKGIVKKLT
jgi:phosphohistidine swiveling domain-containing protein